MKIGDKVWDDELKEFTVTDITNEDSVAWLGEGRAELVADLYESLEEARAARFVGDANDITFDD